MASNTTKRTGDDLERDGERDKRARREDGGKSESGLGSGSDGGSGNNLTHPDFDTNTTTPCHHQSDDIHTRSSDQNASNDAHAHACHEDERNAARISAPAVSRKAVSSHAEGESLICYGMVVIQIGIVSTLLTLNQVPRIKCQRLDDAECEVDVETSTCEGEDSQQYLSLSLTVKRGRLIVGVHSAQELAHMNSKATLVLLEALKYGVQLKLFANRKDLIPLQDNERREVPPEFLFVDVNVFGPEDSIEPVGTLLSKHGVFLQDPRCADASATYLNPHVLDLGISRVDMIFQKIAMDRNAKATETSENADWNIVLDDLPQQHNFDATVVKVDSAVVKTQIMPHQGEALDFMCKRELGGSLMDNNLRFWQLDRSEEGVPVYRHTVTADEQFQPQPEPQGGILADDMGLGKTFTSISLIACSRDRADHFARNILPTPVRDDQALRRCRATLVVVPSTQLMDSWMKELGKHTIHGNLKIAKYHGHDRVRHFSELRSHDIILTTYGTITTEFRKKQRRVLYYMQFFRIILDEAHTIRSRRTKLFQAVASLAAVHHWCLTGTPISNRIDDLGALLEFCRVPLLGDSKCFQQHVSAVARKSIRRGYGVLRETLKPICLRRTRALLDIAQPKSIDTEVTLSEAEQKQYQMIIKKSRKAIDDAVSGRMGTSSRHVMLKVLLQLRIFCNQGTFTPAGDQDPDDELDADEQLTLLEEKEEACCTLCAKVIAMVNQLDDEESGVLGQCSHAFCRTCYDDLERDCGQPDLYRCPVCPAMTKLQLNETHAQTSPSSSQHSSKLNALVENLLMSQNSPTPEKSIVFSAWRKTLNIAADLCNQSNIQHVRIDGTTPSSERSDILHRFTNEPSNSTLLMTMGTGALGLNITAASRIHILEPQWNPAVEDQAVGRAVRLGQAKDATVIRYTVKDSVEKQIQGYQSRKMRLAAGGFEHRNDDSLPDVHGRLNAAFFARN